MIQKEKKQKKVLAKQEKDLVPKDKKNISFIFFVVLNALLFINIVFLGLIVFSADKGLSIYGVARIKGIPYDQETLNNNQLRVGILRTKALDINDLKEGDLVVIPNSINENYLWGAKVISVDFETNKAVTAVSEYYFGKEEILSFGDIRGYYDGECGFFGKLIYFFSQAEGFFYLILISFAISSSVYLRFIYKKKQSYLENVGN